jgi:hypothetical protein
MGMHIVIIGSPIGGLFFYGPFNTRDEAVDWATIEITTDDWWVAPLAYPQKTS